MKTIKIDFVDFEKEFKKEDNFIYNALSKYYNIEISEKPDYLFFSVFSDKNLEYDCVKIFYTGENLCPDFNLCDYAIGYEYLDYQDRYFRLPYYMRTEKTCRLMETKDNNCEDKLAERKFCNFVYSNGNADKIRKEFYEILSEYKKVDSGGTYLNNTGERCKDKLAFQRQYKFSIAFENSSHPGYTTEKLADAFAAQTIPIYWGDTKVKEVFNPKAFIYLENESEMGEVIQKVRELDHDNEKYMNMLREPALKEQGKGYDYCQNEFVEFLRNIFEQDMEKAYRRNRVFWGEYYQKKHLQYYKDHVELLTYKIRLQKIIPLKSIRKAVKRMLGNREGSK